MGLVVSKALHTEAEYHQAMACLEKVFSSARKGTPEGDEFELLSVLIADWERRNVVVERSGDPIELIRYAMENRGMTVADLSPLMRKGRVSEVLNRKRALSIGMIRWFHEHLQLPLEVLLQPYPLDRARTR